MPDSSASERDHKFWGGRIIADWRPWNASGEGKARMRGGGRRGDRSTKLNKVHRKERGKGLGEKKKKTFMGGKKK